MNVRVLIAVIVAFAAMACSTALPRHEVPPYAEHVRASIGPGDRVEVEQKSGHRSVELVSAVSANALVTESGKRIPFDRLHRLYRIGLSPPRNLCDTEEPLACSTPRLLTLLSEYYDEHTDQFRTACAMHDLCYRHGASTYGFDRNECDDRFKEQMEDTCRGVLALDIAELLGCEAASVQFYQAVRRYGEQRYLVAGPMCEYLGPAAALNRQ